MVLDGKVDEAAADAGNDQVMQEAAEENESKEAPAGDSDQGEGLAMNSPTQDGKSDTASRGQSVAATPAASGTKAGLNVEGSISGYLSAG